MKNAMIRGTGSYLPQKSLTNLELENQLDTTHEWIYSRTGISSRHVANATETTSFMAGEAAKKALQDAQLSADDIDLVIAATCTPDSFFPSTACYVKHALGITRTIAAFDVSAACSGFLYGMDIACQYLATGAARHVLVVGSERMSSGLNWSDRSTCVLFGDGSGACILSASEEPGVLASQMHAGYDVDNLLAYTNNASRNDAAYIQMSGNEVFKIAVNIMGDIVDTILAKSQLKKTDINWLIPHQANIRIIQAIAKKLHMPLTQVIITIENQGNTSAASIPLALDYSIKSQRIKRGDILLLEAFGGGMTWGAMVIRY